VGIGELRRMLVAATAIGALTLSLPSVSGAATTFAWGAGGSGALGIENIGEFANVNRATQPAPSPLTGVSNLAAGSQFGIAIAAGTVYSWGAGSLGELGNGTTTNGQTPAAVPGLGSATEVAAGPLSGYALMENGSVEDWGVNSEGQLGQGSHSGPESCGLACSKVPITVPSLSGVSAISARGNHALALLENGTVEAWGGNAHGQLGDGTTVEKDSPVAVGSLSEVVSVAAGKQFSLALLANGEVRAWGDGEVGQLGNGATSNSLTPVAVSGLTGVTAISAGESHALALLSNGEVRSWGGNNNGQLGDGTFTSSDVPVAVSGITGATAVAAGWNHSMAVVAGEVETWGEAFEGQLGNGLGNEPPVFPVNAPVHVLCGLQEIEGIAAGRAQSYGWGASQETCPGFAGVAPGEGPESGGTEVTITGSEFGSVSGVSFGSTPASSFSVESSTRIKAVAPAGIGTVNITVTNANGSSEIGPKDRFTYT
jgi:alpha-tubulin suppressor-like RCC1 family protein